MGGLLLVFLIGSLMLSGGKVTAEMGRLWGEVVEYPIFVVPVWLSTGLAAVATVLVVPLVVMVQPVQLGSVLAAVRYSVVAAGGNLFFALTFPADRGIFPLPNTPGQFASPYWIGAALAILCAIVLIARYLLPNPEYDRLGAAGQLPSGRS